MVVITRITSRKVNKKWYKQRNIIHGLEKHQTQRNEFALVANDFWVKFVWLTTFNRLLERTLPYINWLEWKKVHSSWTGIITNEKCIFSCLDILGKHWSDSIIQCHIKFRTYCIPTIHPISRKSAIFGGTRWLPLMGKEDKQFTQAVAGTFL